MSKKYKMSPGLQRMNNSRKWKPVVARWKKEDPGLIKLIEGMDRFYQSKEGQRLLKKIVRTIHKRIEKRFKKQFDLCTLPDRKHCI